MLVTTLQNDLEDASLSEDQVDLTSNVIIREELLLLQDASKVVEVSVERLRDG